MHGHACRTEGVGGKRMIRRQIAGDDPPADPPVDVGVGLQDVPLQSLHKILVIAAGVKGRLDWLLVVALGLVLGHRCWLLLLLL